MDSVDGTMADPGEVWQTRDGVDAATEPTSPAGAPRRSVGRPRTPPPRIRIELVLVDGPEGCQLRQLRADAVRAVLQWCAANPPIDPTS